ncbi:thaumatin [Radiomyces spectabilis]|uniref:thaumatin n=1 Tax=Radiomyces spectabilis TaxID=64574 RepID=UPI002220A907|nr:thaumatin [Radiomyces spectabilis]KAI8371469.1 thaumatin [Radiomyces spectabilis]
MYLLSSSLYILAIEIVNECPHFLHVGHQTNGEDRGSIIPLEIGETFQLPIETGWAGRIWARESCDLHSCDTAGASNPASLAEFKMNGAHDMDYYDVSFVDGYNLPIRIEPDMPEEEAAWDDPKYCRSLLCMNLPDCPADLRSYDLSGRFVACESACSRYQADEYCCTGEYNSPDVCTTNHFATAIKSACPDTYSYAYDDETSLFGCKTKTYKVIFCPH